MIDIRVKPAGVRARRSGATGKASCMRTTLLLLLIVAAGAVVAAQQTPFRGGADLVSVYATVTDHDGRLITDLTRDDFSVFDNGKRQTITVFDSGVQPITIVVMLDRSGSMAENAALVRDAASQLVTRLLPADRARIGTLGTDIQIEPADFTSDHDALLGILSGDLGGNGPSPIWTAVDRSITALLEQRGRRVVLIFSDGHDEPASNRMRTDVGDVMRHARSNDVMIYAIGFPAQIEPRHISRWIPSGNPGASFPPNLGTSPMGIARYEPPDPALKDLASDSGGGYFELKDNGDLGAIFARVADELHRQYWLGFPPARLDGKTHKLEVKVARDGVTVRARKSYVAQPAGR
jgi:Ca-activated chloride channel homolog